MSLPTEPIDLRRSRGFSQQVNITVEFIRQNYRKLGQALLGIAGIPILLTTLVPLVVWMIQYYTVASGGEAEGPLYLVMLLSGPVQFIVYWVVLVYIIGVVNSYVMLYLEHGPEGFEVEDVRRETKKRFWKILRTMLVVGLVTGFIAIFLFGWIGKGGIIGLLLGFTAISIVVRFLVRQAPIFTVIFNEEETISDAMERSKELVRDHWWLTFGILLLFQALVLALVVILNLPPSLMVWFGDIDPYFSEGLLLAIAMLALSTLATLVSSTGTALPVLAITLHYFNLVEKADGVGTLRRIDTIGGGEIQEPGLDAPQP